MDYYDWQQTPDRAPYFLINVGTGTQTRYTARGDVLKAFGGLAGTGADLTLKDRNGTVWFDGETGVDTEADFEGMDELMRREAEWKACRRQLDRMAREYTARTATLFGEGWLGE